MAQRNDILNYLNDRLQLDTIEDFSINGLQVQGTEQISKVGLATDAAMAVYEKAAGENCELLLAHHGIFWGGGIRSITGRFHSQIKFLLDHDINLFAAHLPLDMHPEIGNNAVLADIIDMRDKRPFGKYHGLNIGIAGLLPQPMTLKQLITIWQVEIGGSPLTLPFGPKEIRSIGIVSGSGSFSIAEAVEAGLDCLVTGDGKHEDHHQAVEGGLHVIYLGHYHSETVGVKAIGKELSSKFDVETVFIDEPTIL
jgi:dinuclear metal center YbgI/SA1388 family protein